jgi:hypothetical protein
MAHMTDEELIKNVLFNYPVYYLMYPGGTGGEFLSNLISIYSSKFRNISNLVRVTDKNRTHVFLLPFFQIVSSCRIQKPIHSNHFSMSEVDDLITTIKNQHDFMGYNIKEKTDEAIAFINENEKPPLLRCHVSTNKYFTNNNTYLLLADNKKWHTYKEILLFLKALLNKHDCPTEDKKIKFFEYERSSSVANPKLFTVYNDALDWVIKNDISEMYEIQLDVIKNMLTDNKITFAEIFNTDPITLFKKYNHIICDFESQYNFIYPKLNKEVISVIKYSKLFKKGYLEKVFNIESDEFHEKLISWHERNLELMSINNFDYTKYKL